MFTFKHVLPFVRFRESKISRHSVPPPAMVTAAGLAGAANTQAKAKQFKM
jgi:hypothetical protein